VYGLQLLRIIIIGGQVVNTRVLILMIIGAMVILSCRSQEERTMKIAEGTEGIRAVIKIDTTLWSYFDPDGFTRKYHYSTTVRILGRGRNMGYRLQPGTTFRFGKDFDVSDENCSGGYLWVSEDRSTLGIALFDIDAPTRFRPLREFNGNYPITETQVKLLLGTEQKDQP
jgi:hypothetical protein